MAEDSRVNILLVDDTADKLLALESVLQDPALNLIKARSGREALRVLLKEDVAVILLDVIMPGMDGFETAALIRQRPTTERTPIIFVSAISTTETHASRGYRLGAVDYIFAPVDPDVLRAKVAAFVELHRKNQQVRAYAQQLEVANARLKESQESLRAIVDKNRDGLVVVEHGVVRFANPASAHFLGVLPAALVGQPFSEELTLGSTEREILLPDGRTCVADQTVMHTSWEGREALLVSLRDITERKRQEAILKETEENLRQSQKQEALGRLAGGVAHDFNNLLTAICGYSEALLDEAPPDHPWRENLEQIRKAGERGGALTNQLLVFTRKQVLAPRVVHINGAVRDMATLLARLIGEDIRLELALDEDLRPVRVDPTQLQQVLMNLVINARDAMPQGGTVRVATENLMLTADAPGFRLPVLQRDYVSLSVEDTGTGMDEDVLLRIFEPFFTTKPVGQGTGLGLAMVYGMVQQSGGTLSVQSAPGEGTRFRICFPVEQPVSAGEPVQPQRRDAAMPAEGETVLVVEDDPSVRGFLCQALRARGFSVLQAEDPDAAERVARDHPGPVHVLVADMLLPGGRGHELGPRLSQRWPSLKVLYISGQGKQLAGPATEPHVAFLSKPFTPQALGERVLDLLRGS